VTSILASYRTKERTFAESKETLSKLMQEIGTIEYLQPQLGKPSPMGES